MLTLAFYKAQGSFSDEAIRYYTGSPYSHVEMRTPSGEWVSASRRDGNKVRVTSIRLKPGHWDLMYLPIDAEECWQRVFPEIGKPYDTLGAILSVTPINASRPGMWFCSELMAYAIQLPKPHTFTPGLLSHSVRSRSLCMSHTRSASRGFALHTLGMPPRPPGIA